MKISVKPSDNIFSELGNNTYDFKDLLSELIDNSVAARSEKSQLAVEIDIFVDEQLRAVRFAISDNATGIPLEKLGSAIAPAGYQTSGSLNEHGLGMKQAVAAIGKLRALTTKTADAASAFVIREFRFGEIEVEEVQFDRVCGTKLEMDNVKPIVTTNPATFTRSIVPYLGARYRRYLKADKATMSLSIAIRLDATGAIQYRWQVDELKPTYFHPGTRENRPVILRYPLSGGAWKAELTFGYAPKESSEYEELGVEVPNKFHPYRVALATQGLDVIFHDRVILFHQLSELGIVNQRHSDHNLVRGEICLIDGFSTAITKNSIIHDRAFTECIAKIREILNGEAPGPGARTENYLQHKTYPDEIPEALLRDRLMVWLTNNPLQPRKNVAREYVVEGIEGYVDVLADGEAWELKRDQAGALDVYQLFMYMDVGELTKGYLVAKSFTTGAHIAAKRISERHAKTVQLTTRDAFPINHPPSAQEREDYY